MLMRSVVVIISSMLGGVCHAADRTLAPLTDEPSRGELFSLYIDPTTDRSLHKTFRFPQHTTMNEDGSKRPMAVFGIDISHHNQSNCQCEIDWSAIADQNVSFVYLKATQGVSFYDRTFKKHWQDLGTLRPKKNIARGAYHFLSSNFGGAEQANHFLEYTGPLAADDLPPCLDLEWDLARNADGTKYDTWSLLTGPQIVARAKEWLDSVRRATGRSAIIYTNAAWWRSRIGEKIDDPFPGHSLWIADYSAKGLASENPNTPYQKDWHIWQFTEHASINFGSAQSRVDANIMPGRPDRLQELISSSAK